ncbi:MAG TPA: pseudouridine synthase, partial [Verrucomicrobiae bacterium]|nr:pseudouridine synthase [Verrucomicrobiae bacterium]
VTEPLDDKEAETRFRVLCRRRRGALLAAYPVTGRMHQIRRHLSMAGFPVIGDRRYGASPRPALTGIALHSFRTETLHPETGRRLIIFAPLPAELLGLLHEVCDDILASILKALPAVP